MRSPGRPPRRMALPGCSLATAPGVPPACCCFSPQPQLQHWPSPLGPAHTPRSRNGAGERASWPKSGPQFLLFGDNVTGKSGHVCAPSLTWDKPTISQPALGDMETAGDGRRRGWGCLDVETRLLQGQSTAGSTPSSRPLCRHITHTRTGAPESLLPAPGARVASFSSRSGKHCLHGPLLPLPSTLYHENVQTGGNPENTLYERPHVPRLEIGSTTSSH